MKEIVKDNVILARHITKEDIKQGLSFFSEDKEFIQVGTWQYDAGKELLAHVHNEVKREINRTYETLYIISGKLEVTIYDIKAVKVDTFEVNAGDILILLESGHGYRIMEDNTRVLEVKNGPYLGAEVDRGRILT